MKRFIAMAGFVCALVARVDASIPMAGAAAGNPDPATYAMVGSGLVGLAIILRSKRK